MQKLELTWVGKDQKLSIEPRILIHNSSLDYGESDSENMIIHGDNLLALKALESKYRGQIKCIYIDPPYNINAANVHFDDFVENSKWLSLMRERLESLSVLLSADGVIFVQIDKEQSAYLKVLMDEIFGREKYITTIAVRMSATSGYKIKHSDKTIVKNTEYLHVYSGSLQIKPIYEKASYDDHYSYILKQIANEKDMFTICQLTDELEVNREFEKIGLDNSTKNLPRLYELSEEFRKYVYEHRDVIGRTHTAPSGVNDDTEYLNSVLINDRIAVKRKYNNEIYYIKKTNSGYNQYIPISLKFNMVDSTNDYSIQLSNILGDWWDGFYLDMGNVDNEGGVYFKNSKKPERLLFRIINGFTQPGDIVLDSFLGSGTTAAVAHKMGRKYIGIELGEHCYSLCVPRLKNVINGDKTGISSFVNWRGGGGYRFYELAPTLLNKDSFGEYVINKDYDANMLAAAVALHEGFIYQPDDKLFWKQSVGSEKSYLFVTTRHIDSVYLKSIKDTMEDDEYLVIACRSYDGALARLYEHIAIKKIPQMLLERCEFDVENYNLNIVHPPEYEDEEDCNEE